ncbi:MAG: hypothetical protein ACLQDY_15285 [Streptosporangiaceae bacterium]
MLDLLLAELEVAELAHARTYAGPQVQLAEVRAVLAAFDWEHDDRQYALEKIERIVTRDDR